jgi:hypothetical protein
MCMCVCVHVLLFGWDSRGYTYSKLVRVSLILRITIVYACVFTPPHPEAGKQKPEQ